MKRAPHLSISPHGRVYLDGRPIGQLDTYRTFWGDDISSFTLDGVNMGPYYVSGDEWIAARSCLAAYYRMAADQDVRRKLARRA